MIPVLPVLFGAVNYSSVPDQSHPASWRCTILYTRKCIEVIILREKSNESAEMYLETILILSGKLPVVRSVDVANELDFKKSSVSIAMRNLREKHQITMTDAGYIFLTDEGRAVAEMIYERHRVIAQVLEKLGVPKEIANNDACRIEHVISQESFEAIKKHIHVFSNE